MKFKHALIALCAALAPLASASAQDEGAPAETEAQTEATLLPESVSLDVVQGSAVPEDCMFPETITDTARFELACVTMPRFGSSLIAAEYLGQLGQLGWRQGAYVGGGMTAVRTDENNCQRILNIFPSNYPPESENSMVSVIWFAMDRTPRCPATSPQ